MTEPSTEPTNSSATFVPAERDPAERDPAALESARGTTREVVGAAGRALLATPEWEPIAPRALLMLVRPPRTERADTSGTPLLWAILDAPEARALPSQLRSPLARDGAAFERIAGDGDQPAMHLAIFTSEGMGRLIEGVTRRSLETRWSARHGEALHDPLHRFELLSGAAARLPVGSLERIIRPLYGQAAQALEALANAPIEERRETALILAGEAAAAVCRIACVLEAGSHPPAEWLVPEARATHLGKRVSSWLDDLVPAISGDERAARWIRETGPGVLRELVAALRAEFAGRAWLDDPQAQSIRPGR